MSAKKKVIIIGSGVGGLATANLLAKMGMEVVLYEKNSEPGGRMGILKKDGFTYDTGPSWYLMNDVFEHYFSLFDKKITDYYELIKLNPAYKVFFDSIDPVTITSDYKKNQKVFENLESGAAAKLEKYLLRAERSYKLSLKYFLYNSFKNYGGLMNAELFGQIPAFMSIFAQSLHGYVARRFSRHQLQQILEYPSVFLGASPFNTPALYQLMSYLDFKEGVFYPKEGGMYTIVRALCSLGDELGVQYKYNSEVSMINTKNELVSGVTVNGKFVAADIVVSNADLHHTETALLKPQHQTYTKKYWDKREPGPSALLLYLGVKGKLPQLKHHNLFFVKEWRTNFDQIYKQKTWPKTASMYVSRTTATNASTAPKGHENIFILVPLPSGPAPGADMIESYTDHYLEQLEEMSGISDLRARIVSKHIATPAHFGSAFHSWQNSALGLGHTLRQSAFMRPAVQSKKLTNLYYVGASTQPGIGVPLCLISAQLVYKTLVGDSSAGPPTTVRKVET